MKLRVSHSRSDMKEIKGDFILMIAKRIMGIVLETRPEARSSDFTRHAILTAQRLFEEGSSGLELHGIDGTETWWFFAEGETSRRG